MLALQQPYKPSPILDGPAFTSNSKGKGGCFTDASAKRVNGKWKYRAVALDTETGMDVIEEGLGGAQVRESNAVSLAVKENVRMVYVDSYAVWAGATQWLCQWEALDWQEKEDWKWLLLQAQSRHIQIGWVQAQANDQPLQTYCSNKVDQPTKVKKIKIDELEGSQHWYRLGEWLLYKLSHTGQEALFLQHKAEAGQ